MLMPFSTTLMLVPRVHQLSGRMLHCTVAENTGHPVFLSPSKMPLVLTILARSTSLTLMGTIPFLEGYVYSFPLSVLSAK